MTDSHKISLDRAARLDSAERRRRQPPEPLVALVAGLLPASLLDLGVGTGYFALPLLDAVCGLRVVAMDAEIGMLSLLRRKERGGRAAAVAGRAAGIPLRDGAVDVVLMVNLYHELDDRPGTLRAVGRALAPGGRVVISDWSRRGTGEAGPSMHHRVPEAAVAADLMAAGFTGVECHELYGDFFTFMARA